MEIDTNIKGYMNIIFSWNLLNWAFESNCISCDHDRNLLVAAVATIASRFHKTTMSSPLLF